jgi:hypothetical protein
MTMRREKMNVSGISRTRVALDGTARTAENLPENDLEAGSP